jgi:hypothetical protein
MSSKCESCPVLCELRTFAQQLEDTANRASAELAATELGATMAIETVDSLIFDVDAEDAIESITGPLRTPDEELSTAVSRMLDFRDARLTLSDSVESLQRNATPSGAGFGTTIVNKFADGLEATCGTGPRRGLKIPLTNVITKTHCTSPLRSQTPGVIADYKRLYIDPSNE